MNTNRKELNLEEMEDVNGGLSLKSIFNMVEAIVTIGKDTYDTIKKIF